MSDLAHGTLQLPIKIYVLWKSRVPKYFETQVNAFTIVFPIFMSGTFTLLISAHRYIKVIHSEYHERTVTNKLLTF